MTLRPAEELRATEEAHARYMAEEIRLLEEHTGGFVDVGVGGGDVQPAFIPQDAPDLSAHDNHGEPTDWDPTAPLSLVDPDEWDFIPGRNP